MPVCALANTPPWAMYVKASRKPPAMARSAARLSVPPVVRECRPPSAVRGGALLVAGGKLLDSPAIAIGVSEEYEPPRRGVLDVSDFDAGVA